MFRCEGEAFDIGENVFGTWRRVVVAGGGLALDVGPRSTDLVRTVGVVLARYVARQAFREIGKEVEEPFRPVEFDDRHTYVGEVEERVLEQPPVHQGGDEGVVGPFGHQQEKRTQVGAGQAADALLPLARARLQSIAVCEGGAVPRRFGLRADHEPTSLELLAVHSVAVVDHGGDRFGARVDVELHGSGIRIERVLPELGYSGRAVGDLLAAEVIDGACASLKGNPRIMTVAGDRVGKLEIDKRIVVFADGEGDLLGRPTRLRS